MVATRLPKPERRVRVTETPRVDPWKNPRDVKPDPAPKPIWERALDATPIMYKQDNNVVAAMIVALALADFEKRLSESLVAAASINSRPRS